MGYCNYIAIKIISTMCCCLTHFIDRDGSWYRKGIIRLKRLEIAKAKLEHELDLAQYLRNHRLSNLAFKVWFNRRQRTSVRYFKRNKVNVNSERKVKERHFDYDRVADECDYEGNTIDRRIL